MGIISFKHKGLQELYLDGDSSKIGNRFHKNALLILDYIAKLKSMENCQDVKNFHELKGKRKNTYSMHVTGNYCITFKWDGHNVFDVHFEDYH